MDALISRIPHKPPAVLIDKVLEVGDVWVRCAVVRQAPAYAADGRVHAAMGLEVMAQAAAVWLCREEGGNGGGMLVQASNLCLHATLLELRSGLVVKVEHLPPDSGTGLRRFRGMILDKAGETLVAGQFMLLVKSK